MARNMYGATSADFTLTSGGRIVPGATVTIWSARTGGTQITDLLDRDSAAATTVTSGADGSILYYGPNNDKTVHWADTGVGSRVAVRPVDITGDPPVLSIGTVGTGAAAANLTGTSEAPVLNLTLPTAGANGVNTAAIQDGAVTTVKIADGAVTNAKLASDVCIGNLLTNNQASIETDTTGLGSYGTGFTTARSTAQAAHGSASLLATLGAATGGVYTPVYTPSGTAGVPVEAGATYTATVSVRAASATPTALAYIQWFDAAGTFLSSSAQVTAVTSSSWQALTVTAVAPASAAYAAVEVSLTGSATNAAYLDKIGLWKGTGGQWAMPGQPIVGMSPIASNGAFVTSGTVAPEGVITAPPLSRYQQTSGAITASGAMEWVKATGTGNTGWQADADADTGTRSLAAVSLSNGWAVQYSNLFIRRNGRTVTFGGILNNATATANTVYTVPSGFRPAIDARHIAATADATKFNRVNITSAGALEVWAYNTHAAGTFTYFQVTYLTNDAWPSSLPGSAI